jgi:Protein of unknown function (DUF2845)
MKNAMVILALVAVSLGAGGVAASEDSSLRCGQRLVELGDHKIDVLGKCGVATLTDRWIEKETAGELRTVDEWTYNWGPQQMVRVLRFVDGRLAHIDVGDYGY